MGEKRGKKKRKNSKENIGKLLYIISKTSSL